MSTEEENLFITRMQKLHNQPQHLALLFTRTKWNTFHRHVSKDEVLS